MATISFPIPSNLAGFLSANFPGLASASGSSDTLALQVPALALPAPVVAGLNEAGFQVPAAVVESGAPAAGSGGAPVGAPQFAPAGFVPQGEAAADPNLAGAVAFAQALGQQASSFFQQAADGEPISQEQFAAFAAQQNAAISDYLFGA